MGAAEAIARGFGRVASYRGPIELGWYDFITGYRRSLLGPLWIVIQFSVWIASLTLLLHTHLGDSMGSYALYVAVGMMVWEPLSGAMTDGPKHLSQHAQLIKDVPIPLSFISVRRLAFLLFRAAMTIPVVLLLVLMFGSHVAPDLAGLALATLLLVMTMYACLVLFGFVGAFNRDFEYLVGAGTRFLFFVTPIFWQADEGARKAMSLLNPLSYYLEIFRAALLGADAPLSSWIVVGVLSGAGLIAAFVVQHLFRRSVVFWI